MTEKRGILAISARQRRRRCQAPRRVLDRLPQGWANSGATRSNWLAIHSLAALRCPATSLLVLSFAAGAQLRGLCADEQRQRC